MTWNANKKRMLSAAALAVLLGGGCSSHLKNVSTDARTGSPPLCFQTRGEARPQTAPGASNIWLMANNTCSYPMDCMVWDDVTEQEHRIVLPGYATNSYLLAVNAQANRMSYKLDCTWNP
jgi:hypothetical protein